MGKQVKNMIKLRDVSKTYGTTSAETHALKNISLDIKEGNFVVLLGPSGSGKSTLLNVMSGLDTVSTGHIWIGDKDITDMNQKDLTLFRRHNLGFVFQQYNLIPTLSVHDNIGLGRALSVNPLDIDLMLEQVGILDKKNRMPEELSGGEQQRVSIARALVKNPKILFCDEPTGALDEESAKDVLRILQELNEKFNTSIVLITHNPAIAKLADTIVKMNSGSIVEVIDQESKVSALDIKWG
jgi:putative ABC transport system ATP-binding protein